MSFVIDLGLKEETTHDEVSGSLPELMTDVMYAKESLDEAVLSYDMLQKSFDSIQHGIQTANAVAATGNESAAITVATESLYIGLSMIGQESITSDIIAGTESITAGNESIKEVLKKMVEKAKEVGKKVLDAIKNFIKKILGLVTKTINGGSGKADDIYEKLLKLKEDGKDLPNDAKVSDDDKKAIVDKIAMELAAVNSAYTAEKAGDVALNDFSVIENAESHVNSIKGSVKKLLDAVKGGVKNLNKDIVSSEVEKLSKSLQELLGEGKTLKPGLTIAKELSDGFKYSNLESQLKDIFKIGEGDNKNYMFIAGFSGVIANTLYVYKLKIHKDYNDVVSKINESDDIEVASEYIKKIPGLFTISIEKLSVENLKITPSEFKNNVELFNISKSISFIETVRGLYKNKTKAIKNIDSDINDLSKEFDRAINFLENVVKESTNISGSEDKNKIINAAKAVGEFNNKLIIEISRVLASHADIINKSIFNLGGFVVIEKSISYYATSSNSNS